MNKLSIAKRLLALNSWLIKEGHEDGALLYPLVENIIVKEAGRLSDAKEDYPDKEVLLDNVSLRLNEADLQKYLGWVLEELIDSEFTEEPDKLIRILKLWERSKARPEVKEKIKDINNWGADSLDKFLTHLPPTSKEKREAVQEKRNAESDIIYNSEKYKVILPKTKFASCQWTGNSTKWCISAKDVNNMFEYYSKANYLLYHIFSKDPSIPDKDIYKRIAVPTQGGSGIAHNELRDSEDNLITEEKIREVIGEEWGAIKARIESDSKEKGFSSHIPERIVNIVKKIRDGADISYKEFRDVINWFLRNQIGEENTSPLLKNTLSKAIKEEHPLIRYIVHIHDIDTQMIFDEIFTELYGSPTDDLPLNLKLPPYDAGDAASMQAYIFGKYPDLFGDSEKVEAASSLLQQYNLNNDFLNSLDFILKTLNKTRMGQGLIQEFETEILYTHDPTSSYTATEADTHIAKEILKKTWEYTDTYPASPEDIERREWKKEEWQSW